MGVRRAVEIASDEAARAKESLLRVYTLGPLIHNPKVSDDLKKLGVSELREPFDKEALYSAVSFPCAVIIRAHGVSPDIEEELLKTGCRVIDATCPKVKQSHLKTQELARAGLCLFLAGEAEHAEIKGLAGYGRDAPFCKVVGSGQEAQNAAESLFKINKNPKTALLGQTTISEDEYEDISIAVREYFPDLAVINTICAAAAERRNALRDLLPQADAVIIAGGRESANTLRLFASAKESGIPCVLAEDKSDIPDNFFNYETIGICAGASTPESVIDGIERALSCIPHFS
jgi:4-hydroxy-3-methylbut-2-enyl diphosphate reductase